MTAPWVMDSRYFAELDESEVRSYGQERLATQIAGDPVILASAIAGLDEESPLMAMLTFALSAIWKAGRQASPELSLMLATAVQGIADHEARQLWAGFDDD